MIGRFTARRMRATGGKAACAAIAALALAAIAPDAAAISRTFVASYGSDLNDCSLPFPCRQFTAALAVTNPGGEIVALDSAGYGAVTIGKSVSIIVPAGIYAGVSVFSGDGIRIAGIGIDVTLQGLTINGQGGVHGVRFVQGSRLNIANCEINGMNGNGVRVEGAGTVVVTRTSIVGSAQEGVFVNAAANVSIVRSRIQSSGGTGIEMGGSASGNIVRSVVANSGLFGIEALQAAAGATHIAIDDASVTDNGNGAGVYAEASGGGAFARIELMNSLVTRNFQGVYAFSQGTGTAAISVTRNDIPENANSGIVTSTSAGTTTVRASHNGVFRNQVAGLLQSQPTPPNPPALFTAGDNYVRDNDLGDNFGAQPDSLM